MGANKTTGPEANNSRPAEALGKFSLVATPQPGAIPFNVYAQPIFKRAAITLFIAGSLAQICMGANFRNEIITDRLIAYTGSFASAAYIIILLFIGLKINGALTRARTAAILANVAATQAAAAYFTHDGIQSNISFADTRHTGLALFVISLPFLAWLTHTAPEAMGKFGVRKGRIIPDILSGLAVSLALSGYMLFTIICFGFKFRNSIILELESASSGIVMNLIIAGFFFMVWDDLRKKGASQLSLIRAMGLLFVSLQTPLFLPHLASIASKVGVFAAIGSMAMGPMIFCLVYCLTFKRFRNAFPAAFTMIILTQLFHAVGLI